jgi:DNA-binding transcriptional ArsR family regulator
MSYELALEALADPTRRALFERIGKSPSSVGELAGAFPISQPAVSQHLRVLREADLVQVRREGTRRIYTVSRKGLEALRAYVESFWSDVLAAFADGASQSPEGAAQ